MALSRARHLVLLLVLAVSLTASAFAHRIPSAQDEALTFALANGATLADFCAGDLDGDGVRDAHCLACQISGTADVPGVTAVRIDLELAFHARVIAPREARGLTRFHNPAHRPQGPPVA